MKRAQRIESIKAGVARSRRVTEPAAMYSAIVRLLRDTGSADLLGPNTIFTTRICEALWMLAEDRENEAMRHVAESPLNFCAWVRRHTDLVQRVLAEPKNENARTVSSGRALRTITSGTRTDDEQLKP